MGATDDNSAADTSGSLKTRINSDLKAALLGGDKDRAMVLRSLKSAVLYEEVAKGVRDSGLPDDEILKILAKEAKKRQESAGLYTQGGNDERAAAELAEKKIIEEYLPAQLTEDEVRQLVDEVAAAQGGVSKETMSATIAAVKQKAGASADGALVARLVRERL